MIKIITFFSLLISMCAFSQSYETKVDTINGFTNKVEAKNIIDSSGLKQGKWIEYLDTLEGNLKSPFSFYFKDIDLSDLSEFIELPKDTNASFYRLVIYRNGKFIGKERIYNLRGDLIREVMFVNGCGKYNKLIKTKKVGKKVKGRIEIQLTNNQFDGICKIDYVWPSGSIDRFVVPFKNGKIHGLQQGFYINENLEEMLTYEIHYFKGKKYGIEKQFIISDGIAILWKEHSYIDDKKNGVSKEYYFFGSKSKGWKPGALHSIATYENDKINGVEYTYHRNGKLELEIPYKFGLKDGIFRRYSENGTIIQEIHYKDDIEVERKIDKIEPEKSKNQTNEFAQAILLGTQILQTGYAIEQNKINNNSQTMSNLANVITNNLTKTTEEAVVSNNQTLSNINNVESLATTNGSNNTNGGSGFSAEKCANDTKRMWESSAAYKNYMNNKSCNKLAYISQKVFAEMLLNSCRQYLPKSEIDGLNKQILNLQSTINNMEDCSNLIRFK